MVISIRSDNTLVFLSVGRHLASEEYLFKGNLKCYDARQEHVRYNES